MVCVEVLTVVVLVFVLASHPHCPSRHQIPVVLLVLEVLVVAG